MEINPDKKQPYTGGQQSTQQQSSSHSRGPGGFTHHQAAPSEAATANRYYGEASSTQNGQQTYRGPEPVYASPQQQASQYAQHQNGSFAPPPASGPYAHQHTHQPVYQDPNAGKRSFWQVPTLVAGGAFLALTAIGLGFIMGQGEPVLRADIPVIYAPSADERVRPANPGGMEVPDRDKSIMNGIVSEADIENDIDEILAMPSAFDDFDAAPNDLENQIQATPNMIPAAFNPGAADSKDIEDLLNLSQPTPGTDAKTIEGLLEELEVNDAWTEGRLLQRRLGITVRNALRDEKAIELGLGEMEQEPDLDLGSVAEVQKKTIPTLEEATPTKPALTPSSTKAPLTLEQEIEQTLAEAENERNARLARQQVLLEMEKEREKQLAELEVLEIKENDALVSASAAGRKLEALNIENQGIENQVATINEPAPIENKLPTFEDLESTEVAFDIPAFGRNQNVEPLFIPASAIQVAQVQAKPRVIQQASIMSDAKPAIAFEEAASKIDLEKVPTDKVAVVQTPTPASPISIFDLPPPNPVVPNPFAPNPPTLFKPQQKPAMQTNELALVKPATEPKSLKQKLAAKVEKDVSSGLSFVTAKNVEPEFVQPLKDESLAFNAGNIAFYQPPVTQQFAPTQFTPAETLSPQKPVLLPLPQAPEDLAQNLNPAFPATLQIPLDLALNQNGSRPFILDPSAPLPINPLQIPAPTGPRPVLPVELSPADIAKNKESLSPLNKVSPNSVPALTASAASNFEPSGALMLSDPLIDKLNKGGGIEVAQLSLDGGSIAPIFEGDADLPPLVEEVEAEINRMNADISAQQQGGSVFDQQLLQPLNDPFGQQPVPQADVFQQQAPQQIQPQIQQQVMQQQQAFQQDLSAARAAAASNAPPEQSPFEGANIPHRPTVPAGLSSRNVGTPYAIQLASVTSASKATKTWQTLQKKHPELLGDMVLGIQQAKVKGKSYFRVQAGPVPNRTTASDLCAALKASRQDCIVAKRK